ncbi:hypothetical protein P9112_013727 [Eukaryota sp. TZLM1-RC]
MSSSPTNSTNLFSPLPDHLFDTPEPSAPSESASVEEQLKFYKEQYQREHQKVQYLLNDREKMRHKIVDIGLQVEKEEEFITNRLLRKLHKLEEEKRVFHEELSESESNSIEELNSTISRLRAEKVEIESALEKELESVIMRLHRRMRRLSRSNSTSSECEPK